MSATVDANVLVYASDADSPLHDRARAFVDSLVAEGSIVYLFWPTIMAYLRLATHSAVFDKPLAPAAARSNVEALLGLPHVVSPGEQQGFWDRFQEVSRGPDPRGNLVPDAHVVALMRQNGVRRIWTADRGFRRFDGIEALDPFEGERQPEKRK